jgi:3-dehydrosphinganine reductase
MSIESSKLNKLKSYYEGKTVVVTGATSGIGRSTALALAQVGANVIIMARTAADLEKTLTTLKELKISSSQVFKFYQIDLRDLESLISTVQDLLKENKVDILVNNAGVYFTNYFDKQTPQQIQSMILTNVMAPLQLTRAFIPHFLQNGFGQVVNVSSLAAKLNFTGYGVYGGTKAGLSHSSKGLNFEYAQKNIFFSDFFAPDSLTRGYEEELKTMPTETKKINGAVKPMSSDDVAFELLKGVASRRLEIIPGAKSKTISFLAKHLPNGALHSILKTLSK